MDQKQAFHEIGTACRELGYGAFLCSMRTVPRAEDKEELVQAIVELLAAAKSIPEVK